MEWKRWEQRLGMKQMESGRGGGEEIRETNGEWKRWGQRLGRRRDETNGEWKRWHRGWGSRRDDRLGTEGRDFGR